jgi:hypothetical protein
MKRLIALALLASCAPAMAASEAVCDAYANFAEDMADARDSGYPRWRVQEFTGGQPKDEGTRRLSGIADSVYENPGLNAHDTGIIVYTTCMSRGY